MPWTFFGFKGVKVQYTLHQLKLNIDWKLLSSRSFGYSDLVQYMSGTPYDSEFQPLEWSGWRGNQTQRSVKDILRTVSYLKTVDDCGDVENSYLIWANQLEWIR